ncbi:MAG: sulfurtransferase TusA family protein [Pseudomonadota bacterium]
MNDKPEQKKIDIDMRGQVCPACLLVAMAQMNTNRDVLQSGAARLCIKTDNREAINTIPTTAQNMGYSCRVKKKENYYEICLGIIPPESTQK